MPLCPPLKTKYDHILSLNNELEEACREVEEDGGDLTKVRELKNNLKETVVNFKMELLTETSYDKERKLHNELGLLETLSNGKQGIKDLFDKEHSFPTKSEVMERLNSEKALIAKKLSQYENPKLLIVPFGKSIEDLARKWKETLVQYKDVLHNEDGSKEEVRTSLSRNFYKNSDSPAYIWQNYETAEKSGDLIYDPVSLDQNHQGKTKQEKIAEIGGYSVILIDDTTNLPAEGESKTKKGRTIPEANHTPQEYLKMLKDPQYQGESGHYAEEMLYLYIRNLHEKNGLVTDNWQENGKATYSVGSYFSGSGRVPSSSWDSGGSRGYLDGDVVSGRIPGYSVRFRVGV